AVKTVPALSARNVAIRLGVLLICTLPACPDGRLAAWMVICWPGWTLSWERFSVGGPGRVASQTVSATASRSRTPAPARTHLGRRLPAGAGRPTRLAELGAGATSGGAGACRPTSARSSAWTSWTQLGQRALGSLARPRV